MSKIINSMSKDEVIHKLYMRYGICISLVDTHRNSYHLNSPYKFKINIPKRNSKEFSCKLCDILYRNYYWMDSAYKMQETYEGRFPKEISGMKSNIKKYGVQINMDDGYTFFFIPDYINLEKREFFHYFDMSYFTCPHCPREIYKKIMSAFEENEEWLLNYSEAEDFEKDTY